MEQGVDLYENAPLPMAESRIDYVFLTHAHIDHSGYLPLLYKRGFRGAIFATDATADLCRIMLLDSAHIQESDAEWKTRKAQRQGKPPVEPLYTQEDALGACGLFRPCHYGQRVEVCPGVEHPHGGRGAPAGIGLHRGDRDRGRADARDRLFRRHRQPASAPPARPAVPACRRSGGDGIHLRRPFPRPRAGLSFRAVPRIAGNLRPGRQRGHPQLRGGPHAGDALLHPPDQAGGPRSRA